MSPLGFTGDLCLGNNGCAAALTRLAVQLDPSLRLVINFEGTLHDSPQNVHSVRQKIVLRSPSEQLGSISKLPVLLISIANNHIGDFGNAAAARTIQLLRKYAPVFGAGYDGETFHLATQMLDGLHLGFAAYCTGDTSPLSSTAQRIGPHELTKTAAEADVQALKDAVDYTIALVHWGDEYYHYPSRRQIECGRMLVDAGFDLVIGHHPHVVQGYESYRDKYIFYSVGNFVFPSYRLAVHGREYKIRWMHRCRWGIIPCFRIGSDGMNLASVLYISGTHREDPRVEMRTYPPRRMRRLNRVLGGCNAVRACARMRAMEALLIRLDEFSVRECKGKIILRKCLGALGWSIREGQAENTAARVKKSSPPASLTRKFTT